MKIKELTLYSSNLEVQKEFYENVIGFKVLKSEKDRISLQTGDSILTFANRSNSTPYHFAFNIPANKDQEALEWLKSRVEILRDGENELQDFDFWNARAMYFYDPDHNIVEFIARKNLANYSNELFDANSVLEISEIGWPTDSIERDFKKVNKLSGVDVYDGSFDRFCAVGDEHGLFIMIDKNKKNWFPTNDKAYSSQFEITFYENGEEYQLGFYCE